jgi:uncharacterized membrane protein
MDGRRKSSRLAEPSRAQPPTEPSAAVGWKHLLKPKKSWWGFIGWVTTAILAVYVAWIFDKKPRLTVAVFPFKIETHRADFDSAFGFTFRGKPIASDNITSIRVAIWNDGNRLIEASDILRSLEVSVPSAHILNATVAKASADTGFICVDDDHAYDAGICRMKWNILQPEDGAILQVLYEGAANLPIVVSGSFKGQKQVVVEQYQDTGKPNVLHLVTTFRWRVVMGLVVMAVLVFVVAMIRLQMSQSDELLEMQRKYRKEMWRQSWMLMLAILLGCVAFGILIIPWPRPGPPFGW